MQCYQPLFNVSRVATECDQCDQNPPQKVDGQMIAKIIPSESETNEKGAKNDNEGTEDKSGSANDPRKGEMEADKAGEGKTTNRRNSAKARPRPKTAPPSRHPTVESIFQ